MDRVLHHPAARAAAVATALLVVALLMLSTAPSPATSLATEVMAPELTSTLGVSTATAVRIWDAYNSPIATALSVLLIPLGFGAWAVTIRLTISGLIKRLGKKAARRAALAF